MDKYFFINLIKKKFLILTIITLIISCSGKKDNEGSTDKKEKNVEKVQYVDPFQGIHKGNVFAGTCLPFSLVRLGPDFEPPEHTNGYNPKGDQIMGFSHTHTSGTGGGGRYGNIMLAPLAGGPDLNKTAYGYIKNEYASPGYYQVGLGRKEGDVAVKLTSTPHAGMHKYRFYTWGNEKTFPGTIMIDVGHTVTKPGNPDSRCIGGKITVTGKKEVKGYGRYIGGWGGLNPYKVYFVAQFDNPFKKYGTWQDSTLRNGNKTQKVSIDSSGVQFGAYAKYQLKQDQVIKVKVGISLISTEKARKNLQNEIPRFNFARVRQNAAEKWNERLSRIDIKGGTPEQRSVFYSCLYHSMIMPTDLSNGENPQWNSAKPHFWDHYCLWDVFRTTMPLNTLINKKHQQKVIQGLLDIYKHKGWLPDAWIAGDYAFVQGGSNADVVIADAMVKNLGGFDKKLAYEAVKKNASVPADNPYKYGRVLKPYKELGYLPYGIDRSVSRTLEYSYNDFCVSLVAENAGKTNVAEKYRKRSMNAFNLFLEKEGFFWGKDSSGNWMPDFEPGYEADNEYAHAPFYYEGNPWTYSTYCPHNVAGLIKRHGGKKPFVKFLDRFFDEGHFSIGNEPAFLAPYLYNYAGRPDKTAVRVRNIIENYFTMGRRGLPGQDDSGAMSSWYVFSAMGFYPNAGQDIYLIGSPLFSKIELKIGNNKTFKIIAKNNSSVNKYVQSATLNGKPLKKCWFRHKKIKDGGKLVLKMGKRASDWGTDNPPPSIEEY